MNARRSTVRRRFTTRLAAVPVCRALIHAAVLLTAVSASLPASAADFRDPTHEELSMTSLPGYPGVPAVVLYREELTKDDLHSVLHYERIKILTDEGRKYANVELSYFSSTGDAFSVGDDKSLEEITGRTIHPDGTIIPFTGKPYLKVLEKTTGYKVQEKIFTLPDVQVGSIIEYRYYTRINDSIFEAPTWKIQDDLYVKEAHFAWWPTTKVLVDEDRRVINSISWFPMLPAGAKIETREVPGAGMNGGTTRVYEVHVKDVPPYVKEEFMPPIASFSYGVHFAFTPYRSQPEYWQAVGKQWSKHVNSFANPGPVKDATDKITAGAATPEDKLKKIYEAVMALENTRYTRDRDQREDKAAGMSQIKTAADVLTHGRGTPTQITELFIAMVRAAGLNASAMYVPDRSERLFTPYWMNINQLDDLVAIVNVNGADTFLDPGTRYCPYGQLAWQHTLVQGVRQTDGNNTVIASSPGVGYKLNHMTRVANLNMDASGEITGKVDLSYTGSAALRWRHQALRGDEEEVRKDLRKMAEGMLPKTLEIGTPELHNLAEYEKPLTVTFKITGTLGNAMGKRTMLPADVFLSNQSATFPHDKRELAVDFHYPWFTQDAVRVNLPKALTVEAVPTSAQYKLTNMAAYSLKVDQTPTAVTTHRDFIFGGVLMLATEYPELRKFYTQFESKDQESIILKTATAPATVSSTATPQP